MRIFKPKGVTILRRKPDRWTDPLRWRGPFFDCLIKSRGRTGADVRSRLMALTLEQRQPILEAWSKRQCADFPEQRPAPTVRETAPRHRPIPRAIRRADRMRAYFKRKAARA